MSGPTCLDHCEVCPVPPGLPCYCDPARCRRAARDGEEAFRAILVKHARAGAAKAQETPEQRRARKPRVPLGVKQRHG